MSGAARRAAFLAAVVAAAAPPAAGDPAPVTGAAVDEAIVRTIVRVDPGGAGDAATIAAGLAKAGDLLRAGTPVKVAVAAGTYREPPLELPASLGDAPLVIEGAGPGQTIWSGADLVPAVDWRDEGGGVWSCPWPHAFGVDAPPWVRGKNSLHARAEMAWVDGRPLRPIELERYTAGGYWTINTPEAERGAVRRTYDGFDDPRAALRPGTFGVAERPENGRRLFVRLADGGAPAARAVEVAARRTLLTVAKPNVVLRGLTLEKSAGGGGGQGVLVRGASDVLFDRVALDWHGGVAVEVAGARGVTFRGGRIAYNGMGGGATNESAGVVVEDVTLTGNGWRDYFAGDIYNNHNGGGIKFHTTVGVRCDRVTAVGNLLIGLWFDIHCEDVLVRDSTVAYNARDGMLWEISRGPFVAERVLAANNAWANLSVSASDRAALRGCIAYAPMGPAVAFDAHTRGDGHAGLKPLTSGAAWEISRCVLAGGEGLRAPDPLVAWDNRLSRAPANGSPPDPDPGRPEANFRGADNLFFAGDRASFKVAAAGTAGGRGTLVDLAGWAAALPGVRDAGRLGRWADPQFADPDRGDFRARPGSPLAGRDDLPLRAIDPAVLRDAAAFFAWVRGPGQVEPYDSFTYFFPFADAALPRPTGPGGPPPHPPR